MGSDQSSLIAGSASGTTGPVNKAAATSSEIPYTSYSVGRPIGDSPKKEVKKRQSSPQAKVKQRIIPQDIVVVKEGSSNVASVDSDPELISLQHIPTFLPIMRGALNIPTTRDHMILDKLDTKQVLVLCLRYQDHIKQCAEAVAFDQNSLITRIKEIDFAINTLMNLLVDRQRKFAKYAEQLNKVHEVSSALVRIRSCIQETLVTLDELNKELPEGEGLEPFVLTPPHSAMTG